MTTSAGYDDSMIGNDLFEGEGHSSVTDKKFESNVSKIPISSASMKLVNLIQNILSNTRLLTSANSIP